MASCSYTLVLLAVAIMKSSLSVIFPLLAWLRDDWDELPLAEPDDWSGGSTLISTELEL